MKRNKSIFLGSPILLKRIDQKKNADRSDLTRNGNLLMQSLFIDVNFDLLKLFHRKIDDRK